MKKKNKVWVRVTDRKWVKKTVYENGNGDLVIRYNGEIRLLEYGTDDPCRIGDVTTK